MSILAIDYGKKRIGLAVCSTSIPTPLKPILTESTDEILLKISEIINEYSVSEVVIGLPLNMNDTEGEMATEVRKFASKIEKKFGLKIVFADERLTSKEAEKKLAETEKSWRKRKGKIDSAAACLILKSYLER
ncbi:MAG: Holliday junction resolvase RuvX [Elusimicrobia bacterium]|nr:Holliday junction resolvase RuvX [Elusimicrobiota bacterium]